MNQVSFCNSGAAPKAGKPARSCCCAGVKAVSAFWTEDGVLVGIKIGAARLACWGNGGAAGGAGGGKRGRGMRPKQKFFICRLGNRFTIIFYNL